MINNLESGVDFQNGLYKTFELSQPYHISFQFASTDIFKEDCNVRLKNSQTGNTTFLFRAGNNGLIRVNEHQTLAFYNESVSSPWDQNDIKWTQIDALIKWDKKKIAVFINQNFTEETSLFYSEATQADTLLLYSLRPGSISYFRNVKLCSELCEGIND